LQSELVRGEVPPVLPDSREGNLKDLDSLLMRTVMKAKEWPGGENARAILTYSNKF
jgi:hypothetical protein